MQRIAIIEGVRSPIAKVGGKLKNIQADMLGAHIVRELTTRLDIPLSLYDEVIMGNVSQPAHAANIARVIALRAGFPESTIASTVHRNCASGMESITDATNKIRANDGEIFVAGGVESMSNIPLLYNKEMTSFFDHLFHSKSIPQKLTTLLEFRPNFLQPVVGLMSGLTDPISGMLMGNTAEILAKDFGISRLMQDQYSLGSHQKAQLAQEEGRFAQEIAPIVYDGSKGAVMCDDDGIRFGQNIEALSKLKPFFDKRNGTVTAGNASQISDAAAAVVLMSERKAKAMGLEPLGYLSHFSYAGLEPDRMGLGPVYSTSKLFEKSGVTMQDIELIELNEAFAAQVLANQVVFASDAYAKEHLGRSKAVGEMDTTILNVNGGGIALGHPVGMTGTRIVIHTLKELRRRNKNVGLATLCIGGGQGASMLLEVV